MNTKNQAINEFPHVVFVDLEKYEIAHPKVSIANIQVKTPNEFFTDTIPPKLSSEKEIIQKEKIFMYIEQAIKMGADFIILPELSITEGIRNEIWNKFGQKGDVVFIMGSYYNTYKQNVCDILLNNQLYGQFKNNPSNTEKNYMKKNNDIHVFINTSFGDFAVLVCYDATDFSILTALRDYTDFLFCVARTSDLTTFENIFNAITYLNYQNIVFCNDGIYGGSSFFSPFHGNRRLDQMGVENEGILYREFDILVLDKMRDLNREKNESYKYPPPTSHSRHLPNVEIANRKKEYFQSNSFNYLSYLYGNELLRNFLANINLSLSGSGEGAGASVYKVDNILFKSIKSLCSPALTTSFHFYNLISKIFLWDIIKRMSNDRLDKINETIKNEIIDMFKKYNDKQYILIEINMELLKLAIEKTPELLEEIIRINQIDKEKELLEIPDINQVETDKNDEIYKKYEDL